MGRDYYQVVRKKILDDCLRRGISKSRLRKYLIVLEEAQKLGINFRKLTDKEIDKYFFYLMESKYSDWTRLTKWRIFKRICRLIKKDKNIDFSKWKLRVPKLEPEILSIDEVKALINHAPTLRDKLIIMLLYEGGLRLGELLNLKTRDVIFDNYGVILRINGKTGVRYIRIVESANLLKLYIELYPVKEKLFDISHAGVRSMLKKTAKIAGIKKRVYPHLLRHTRATHLAKYLTESELKVYFGWSRNSKMPSVYVHLSARDVDEKIINIYFNKLIRVFSSNSITIRQIGENVFI